MSFRALFLSVLVTTALIVSAFVINSRRPRGEVSHATPALVRATGKCAECHRKETVAVVHEYELSRHAVANVNCLNCHQPVTGQESAEHKGFTIAKKVTANNCKQCHPKEYDEYLQSRHAAPAWAAVTGKDDFSAEQIAFAEAHDKGSVDRPPHPLTVIQGTASVNKGCLKCHEIGRPNKDGSIGSCTACHARHVASVEVARQPETCGACHMGPDHSQLEIYHESKHGVLFAAQKQHMDLTVRAKDLKASDMPVPTCSTCHLSGLEGEKMTHDVGSRLSYYLFDAVSERRPEHRARQAAMKTTCLKCHTTPNILQFYGEAEAVVKSANKLVKEAQDIIAGLHKDKLLTPEPLDEPAELLYFDLWHYGGRTAKHGAFMGGADFVQWHGYYVVVSKLVELKKAASDLRREKGIPETKEAAPAETGGETGTGAEAMLNSSEIEWLTTTLGDEAGR